MLAIEAHELVKRFGKVRAVDNYFTFLKHTKYLDYVLKQLRGNLKREETDGF